MILKEKIDYLPAASEDQFNIQPIYKTFRDGKKTQGIKNIQDLPENAKNIFMLSKTSLEQKFQVFPQAPKEMILF